MVDQVIVPVGEDIRPDRIGAEPISDPVVGIAVGEEGSVCRLVHDDGAAELSAGDQEDREFDTLVMALTNSPLDHLSRELEGSGIDVRTIGDAVAARTASMAIYEGRALGLVL